VPVAGPAGSDAPVKAGRAVACETLRALHRFIAGRAQEFSALLSKARRNNEELEELLACAVELADLFAAAAEVQETVLYPALERWAGGPGGPIERARREHAALRMRLADFHGAVERMIFAPAQDRAERTHMLERGHELLATFEQHLGTEGDYLYRLADDRLDEERGLAIDARVRDELARRLPGRDPAWGG
jgi:hemerythrin-like domain-containing protein